MKNLLPLEYRFAHEFAIDLHDWMVTHLLRGEKERLFETNIPISKQADLDELQDTTGDALFDWMMRTQSSSTVGTFYVRALFPALLSDFLHFVFESLSCSRKGKLTVAYALLRKPLRENLAYLEWLLGDPDDFINKFHAAPSSQLSLGSMGSRTDIIARIRAASSRTIIPDICDADLMYNIRYDKNSEYGFEELWNKALHLITTKHPISTEQGNLNFVFSTQDDALTQWHHLYSRLPLVLLYAVQVVDSLMVMATGKDIPGIEDALVRRALGLAIWNHDIKAARLEVNSTSEHMELDELIPNYCPRCKTRIVWHGPLLQDLYRTSRFACATCLAITSLADLHSMLITNGE